MPNNRPSKTNPADAGETGRPAAPHAERTATGEMEGREATSPETAADPSAALPSAGPENALPNGQPAAAEKAAEEQTSPLESLRTGLKEAQDRALRMQAELENYRKRAAREMQDQRRYANLPLMRDLLPALDNMDRAIEAAEKTHDTAGLLEGVKMVARHLKDVLQRHHCVRIPALNEPFDPYLHEAISQQPSAEHPGGTVLLVTQAGFQLHDRVVRPSQVIVSSEKQPEGKSKEEPQEEESL